MMIYGLEVVRGRQGRSRGLARNDEVKAGGHILVQLFLKGLLLHEAAISHRVLGDQPHLGTGGGVRTAIS